MFFQPPRSHELALSAGRQLQNSQTGFVHLCYEKEERRDLIPLLENVAFVLALLRSRKSEQVLEGKALLEKILGFESKGNFPVYVHEYPLCRDEKMAWKLAPYFFWMVKEFGSVLGSLTETLEPFLKEELLFAGPRSLQTATPQTVNDWIELCIAAQMAGREDLLEPAALQWNETLCLYLGKGDKWLQEKGEPALCLFDLMMGEWTGQFPKRSLAFHPLQVRASLIRPAEVKTLQKSPYLYRRGDGELPLYIAWGGAKQLHSFALARQQLRLRDDEIWLPEEVPEEGDKNYEIAFYLNIHPDHKISFGGKKASAFTLDEGIEITSGPLKLGLTLHPSQGKGQFFGHLMRGNRPSQLAKQDAYDWKIAIRTISREKVCSLQMMLALDYQEPLS